VRGMPHLSVMRPPHTSMHQGEGHGKATRGVYPACSSGGSSKGNMDTCHGLCMCVVCPRSSSGAVGEVYRWRNRSVGLPQMVELPSWQQQCWEEVVHMHGPPSVVPLTSAPQELCSGGVGCCRQGVWSMSKLMCFQYP
jgi:hypothetical protein